MSRIEAEADTLAVFSDLPEIRPPFEYFGGRIIQKMSPKIRHSIIQTGLSYRLMGHCLGRQAGRVFIELRCTFGGESHVFDLCYFAEGRIPRPGDLDEQGNVRTPPDLAIEVLSPGQTVGELSRKLRSAIRRGVKVGWLIDEARRQVLTFRPRKPPVVLEPGESLSAEDLLPGFSLPVGEMFDW